MGGIQQDGCRGRAGDGKGSRRGSVHKEGKTPLGLVLNLMQSRYKALLKSHVIGALKEGGEYFRALHGDSGRRRGQKKIWPALELGGVGERVSNQN